MKRKKKKIEDLKERDKRKKKKNELEVYGLPLRKPATKQNKRVCRRFNKNRN